MADRQAALVRALTGSGHPPEGFDPVRLHAASQALALKRAREAGKAWPRLRRDLGENYLPRFLAYAAILTVPPVGGPFVDALQFAAWEQVERDLSGWARAELARGRAHWSLRRGGVRRRRVGLALAVLDGRSRIFVAVRLPVLGSREISLGG